MAQRRPLADLDMARNVPSTASPFSVFLATAIRAAGARLVASVARGTITRPMRAWQDLVSAASLLPFVLVAAGCATFELDVPVNASGSLPDYVGRPCEDASEGPVSVRNLDGSPRWNANGAGSVRVKCAKGTLKLNAVKLARLVVVVDPPIRLSRHTEFSVRAHGESASGEAVELWHMRENELTWEHPPDVELNQPRCGHMMPLCVGSVGNGNVMRARVVGDAPVQITLKAAGLSQAVTLTPPAKD